MEGVKPLFGDSLILVLKEYIIRFSCNVFMRGPTVVHALFLLVQQEMEPKETWEVTKLLVSASHSCAGLTCILFHVGHVEGADLVPVPVPIHDHIPDLIVGHAVVHGQDLSPVHLPQGGGGGHEVHGTFPGQTSTYT